MMTKYQAWKKKFAICVKRFVWILKWRKTLGTLESMRLAWKIREEADVYAVFENRIKTLKIVCMLVINHDRNLYDQVQTHINKLESVISEV
jgi:hypothetical protein